jgi:hypothetical protein
MAIACISAFPAMINPGMISCDLALDSVLARLGIREKVDRFNLEQTRRVGSVNSRHLKELDRLENYRAIVFWGDFQHFLNYAVLDLSRRERTRYGLNFDRGKFLSNWASRAFLTGRRNLQARTIVFGETIYGLSGMDLAVIPYQKPLRQFLTNVADVQLRDPLSVAMAQQIAPGGRIGFGCDCAFLLDADKVLPMTKAGSAVAKRLPKKKFAVAAFGRSDEDDRLTEFARKLAEKAGVELVTINWLAPHRYRALSTIAENIAIVRQAQFVVTDIYHLIVTALRENRPVLGMGWGASHGRTTLDDKKKELLLRSYFGRHLYTFVEDVVAREVEALERAANNLVAESRHRVVRAACRKHRIQSEARLGEALTRILAA